MAIIVITVRLTKPTALLDRVMLEESCCPYHFQSQTKAFLYLNIVFTSFPPSGPDHVPFQIPDSCSLINTI